MMLDMFEPYLNQTYKVDIGAEKPVELTLISAKAKNLYPNDGRYGVTELDIPVRVDPFTLLFAGPEDAFLPQWTYAFSHEETGSFTMMIVPVGKDARGYLYEAVFG